MRPPRCLRFRFRRPFEAALFGAALLGFVTANLGLPLLVPVVDVASSDAPHKDKSTPFPCQNRPCGCLSADACMRSCCCFTPKERLAWARAHNVEPLPELIAAAAAEACEARHDEDHGNCEHCAKAEKKPASRACCPSKESHRLPATSQTATAAEQKTTWRVMMVVGSLAAKCHGMGPWSATGFVAIPPSAEVSYAFDWACAEDVCNVSPRLLSAIHSPPTRPPCC